MRWAHHPCPVRRPYFQHPRGWDPSQPHPSVPGQGAESGKRRGSPAPNSHPLLPFKLQLGRKVPQTPLPSKPDLLHGREGIIVSLSQNPQVWLAFILSKESPPVSIPGRKMQGKLKGLLQTCTGGVQSAWGWGLQRHGEAGAGGRWLKWTADTGVPSRPQTDMR